MDVALTRLYLDHLTYARNTAAQVATRAWDQLGTYDQADIARFVEAIDPGVAAARAYGTDMTAAYIGTRLGDIPSAEPSPGEARRWVSPFLATWKARNDGHPEPDALSAGRNRVDTVARDWVTDAVRSTATAIDVGESRLTSWVRVPGGMCCEWCAEAAMGTYSSADACDFGHDACDCTPVPEIDGSNPGAEINRPLEGFDKDARFVDSTGDPVESAPV